MHQAHLSPVGDRWTVDGVEISVDRRIKTPFVQHTEANEVTPIRQTFSGIPSVPIRRIDNVFVQQENKSSIFSSVIDSVARLLGPYSNDGSVSHCRRSHNSAIARHSSVSECQVDALVSGMQGITFADPDQSHYSGQHRVYPDGFPAQTSALPLSTFSQLSFPQSTFVAPQVNVDVEMRFVGNDSPVRHTSAPRSAMKGARFRDTFFGCRFNPYNRVSFNERIQVHPVAYWIDLQRDIQKSTHIPLSPAEKEQLAGGWSKEERSAAMF